TRSRRSRCGACRTACSPSEPDVVVAPRREDGSSAALMRAPTRASFGGSRRSHAGAQSARLLCRTKKPCPLEPAACDVLIGSMEPSGARAVTERGQCGYLPFAIGELGPSEKGGSDDHEGTAEEDQRPQGEGQKDPEADRQPALRHRRRAT